MHLAVEVEVPDLPLYPHIVLDLVGTFDTHLNTVQAVQF
jgi:hypothetical protein